MLKGFLVSLQFMTRLAIPQEWTADFDFEQTHKGVVSFPLVGVVLGCCATGICWTGFNFLGWGAELSSVVYLLMLAALTGGFHLDGLADSCDGIFSARKRQRMLEIMKDSRLGTHGALALFFVLSLKWLAVARLLALMPDIKVLWVLVLTPVVGRSLMPLLMYRQHYAREQGLGHVYIGRISRMQLAVVVAICTLILSVALRWQGLCGLLVSYLFALLYRRYINVVLGGQTGDTLGAGNELFELCFLMVMTSVLTLN